MRMLRTSARAVTVAGFAAVLTLPTAEVSAQGLSGPAEGESISAWTERWMDGPVSLIATEDEKSLYGDFDSARQRLQFIRLFWERRDTQFRGPRNEFLDEFEARLGYAEDEFGSDRSSGWETVFGQVVLLFGEPARTRREMGLPEGFSDRPAILWSYDDQLPGMEPNEDLLFVFRAGRWKLMPPYPSGPTGVPESIRAGERQSNVGPAIPADYQMSVNEAIEDSLINPVDYDTIRDRVDTAVQLPDAQIPFAWTVNTDSAPGEQVEVTIDFTWRLGALIFHLVDEQFVTDMVVDVQLMDEDDIAGTVSERVRIEVPQADMNSRLEETVTRKLTFAAPAGTYNLEILLLDQLLGYRTVYRDNVSIERP
ncbi:MAG: GWxTD domain-containing protein [Acidobacteria bacterium]|nr:GWxTD domain-containing protein [Acidobacteriota bacterium]